MKDFYRNKMKDILRPRYYFCKDIFDFSGRKRLKKNVILSDLCWNKRGFLLLTGESLQRIDIKKLKDEYTFGVGYIFLHEDIKKIDLTFYMTPGTSKDYYPGLHQWPESCLGPLGHGGIARFYQEVDKGLGNKTTLFLNNDSHKYIEMDNLFKDKAKYFIKTKKRLYVARGKSCEKLVDLTKRTVSGGGSVFFSILIMMYMGFKEIYLCGAGYTYEPAHTLHFYDNIVFPKRMGREEAEIEARKAIEVCNYKFSSTLEYYGLFEKDDFYRVVCVNRMDYGLLREKHRILSNYAKSQGVKIYNIVPDEFESPIYEKISWQKVADEVLSINSNKT